MAASSDGARHDAFLSYGRGDDQEFRDALVAGLTRAGHRIWVDRDAMPNRGTTFGQEIRRAIEASDRLLLLAGPDALSSAYVAQEWGHADDLGIPVLPVLPAGAFGLLPRAVRHYHGIDARPPRPIDAVIADVARVLSEPVQLLGPCYHVPAPPPHAQPRPEVAERLAGALLADRRGPQEAGRAGRVAVLYGLSGAGKSTAAAAFARSTRVRRVFPGGIAWLVAGPAFSPLASARELLRLVAPGARQPESDADVELALATALAGREILVVLDGAGDPDTVAPFAAALGPGGRLLVTTLDSAVATALGTTAIPVGQLDDDGARRMLADWSGGPLPPEADPVLEACDGLPFALAVVGAMVANRTPWRVVADALEARRLDLISGRFPGYPHRNVLRVLAASYDALAAGEPAAAGCYLELAAFLPGVTLSAAALVRLWSRPGRLGRLEAELVVPALERRLLLQAVPGGFRVHALHEDFVRLQHPDPAGLAAALVETYRTAKGSAAWAELDDDGYLFDHLVEHLTALEDHATVADVVDTAWVRRQWMRRGDLGQALDDVRTAAAVAAEPPVDLVTVSRLAVLSGRIAGALRGAPPLLVGALALVGDVDRALRWAGDQPDPTDRFAALLSVARALVDRAEVSTARRVVRVAAKTIGELGGTVEAATIAGLTALNAVHAIVDFPQPDEWEGTTDDLVEIARMPLDALVLLAPVARAADALADLTEVTNPAWELYAHLLPLAAAEQLAVEGFRDVAEDLLDAYPAPTGTGDLADSARYRIAVAQAAVGRYAEARAAIDDLPLDYRGVGLRGLARHLARDGRVAEALDLLDLIDDETVADAALQDVLTSVVDEGDAAACQAAATYLADRGRPETATWLAAAGGDTGPAEAALAEAAPAAALGLGTSLAEMLWQHGDGEAAVRVVRSLVPAAEAVLGPQWFAPETVDAEAELSEAAAHLAALLVRTGEPLPQSVAMLSTAVEHLWGGTPRFRLRLAGELAAVGRLGEAAELASAGVTPGSRALGLAAALASAEPREDDAGAVDELRAAGRELAGTIRTAGTGDTLDELLGDAISTLVRHNLDTEASALVEALLSHPGPRRALGDWAWHLAVEGRDGEVRDLIRRLLVDEPMAVPPPVARAGALIAVTAARAAAAHERAGAAAGSEPARRRWFARPRTGAAVGTPDAPDGIDSAWAAELAAAVELLADLRTAAGALDVLSEAVDLRGRVGSFEAAAEYARTVVTGEEADLADRVAAGESVQIRPDLSTDAFAVVWVVRAVAAASMVLVAVRAGRRRDAVRLLAEAEQHIEEAHQLNRDDRATEPVARYLAAARAAVHPDRQPGDLKLLADVGWFLLDRGLPREAADFAGRAIAGVRNPFDHLPSMSLAEDANRLMQLMDYARLSLRAVLVLAAPAHKDRRAVADLDLGLLSGLPTLTLAERSELQSRLALALRRTGELEKARQVLALALGDTLVMAARGELDAFSRLCQAVVAVLPADEAVTIWALWLRAAAETGAGPAVLMIAHYVRWLPAHQLAALTVDPASGELRHRAVRG